MRLTGKIVETVQHDADYIIVKFKEDKQQQHFMIFTDAPFKHRMRLGNCYLMNIKWKSIVMPDVNGEKTYETQLHLEGFVVPMPDWEN